MLKSITLCACLAAASFAQENPLSASFKMAYTQTKTSITRAAEKMPEDQYGFKPSDDVRSFGQVIGHVADAQYMFCAPVLGDSATKPPGVEKSATTKAALVEAVKTAFAYCDKAYDAMTDAKAVQVLKFFGRDNTGGGVLAFNSMHNYEHYGNIATYMRIKGVVPPTSEPRPAATKKSN